MTVSSVLPDTQGHFGAFGGRYVPEVLMTPLEELEQAYLMVRLAGVDACSRLESASGKKDARKMRDFVEAAWAAAPQEVST